VKESFVRTCCTFSSISRAANSSQTRCHTLPTNGKVNSVVPIASCLADPATHVVHPRLPVDEHGAGLLGDGGPCRCEPEQLTSALPYG
jgi:hypothetical protein